MNQQVGISFGNNQTDTPCYLTKYILSYYAQWVSTHLHKSLERNKTLPQKFPKIFGLFHPQKNKKTPFLSFYPTKKTKDASRRHLQRVSQFVNIQKAVVGGIVTLEGLGSENIHRPDENTGDSDMVTPTKKHKKTDFF